MDCQPHRILVAEDNPPLGNIAKLNLEQAGFRVDVVHNGREALELALSQHLDLILRMQKVVR